MKDRQRGNFLILVVFLQIKVLVVNVAEFLAVIHGLKKQKGKTLLPSPDSFHTINQKLPFLSLSPVFVFYHVIK